MLSRASGENYDNGAFKGQYYLTDEEESLLASLRKQGKKIIAIVNSGYTMDVRFLEKYQVEAAIWTGFSGMLGGEALVDILNGTVNPSGKLPDTWALDYYDIPSSRNFYMAPSPDKALGADSEVWINTVYEEDMYVGYRYFETFGVPVAFPFGHGLSYTQFEKSCRFEHDVKQNVSATVQIKNTGRVAGKECTALYVEIPDGKLEQPVRRLLDFGKTEFLMPGESGKVVMKADAYSMASFDEEISAYIMEAGTYRFYVGASVKELDFAGSLTLEQSRMIRKTERYMESPMEFTRLSKKDPSTFPAGKYSGIYEGSDKLPYSSSRRHVEGPELSPVAFPCVERALFKEF